MGTPQVSLPSLFSLNGSVKSDQTVNPMFDPGALEIRSFSNFPTVSTHQAEEKADGPRGACECCLKLPLYTHESSEISFYLKAPYKFRILLLIQPCRITIRTSVLTTYRFHSQPAGVFSLLYCCFWGVRARTRRARHLRRPCKETHPSRFLQAPSCTCWTSSSAFVTAAMFAPGVPFDLSWSLSCWAYDKPQLEKPGTKQSFLPEIQAESHPATCAH